MILNFRHNGLRRFWERGERHRMPPEYAEKVAEILHDLDSRGLSGVRRPGYGLHSLRGDLAGHWAVRVSANWRITFRSDGMDVYDVDLVDYH